MMNINEKISEKLDKVFSDTTHRIELVDKMTESIKDIYLEQGYRGDIVKSLQAELFKLGFLSEECISGVFGEMTKAALYKAIGACTIRASDIQLLKNIKPFIIGGTVQNPSFIWAIILARDKKLETIEYNGSRYSSETMQKLS